MPFTDWYRRYILPQFWVEFLPPASPHTGCDINNINIVNRLIPEGSHLTLRRARRDFAGHLSTCGYKTRHEYKANINKPDEVGWN
jgi:hypothetical protein